MKMFLFIKIPDKVVCLDRKGFEAVRKGPARMHIKGVQGWGGRGWAGGRGELLLHVCNLMLSQSNTCIPSSAWLPATLLCIENFREVAHHAEPLAICYSVACVMLTCCHSSHAVYLHDLFA